MVTDGEMGTHTRTVAESGRRGSAPLITDARMATSDEMSSRIRRYTITMAFRAACFISMIFVSGTFRWVLFACAVVLAVHRSHCRKPGRPAFPLRQDDPRRAQRPPAAHHRSR